MCVPVQKALRPNGPFELENASRSVSFTFWYFFSFSCSITSVLEVLSCQKWTGKKVDPWSNFSAKSGPSLPKVDLVQFCQEKSGPGPVSLSKSKQVHFWQGKKVDPVQFCWQVHFWQGEKVDPVQFRCRNPGRSILAGEKSGPGPVSLPKSRQVHFWQGKKVDPVQFRCRNPGRSIFGRGKKWTRSSFSGRSIFGKGKKVDPKSRQVHFWQGNKVDLVQFFCQNLGRSFFGKGKKWTRSSFAAEI